MPFDATPTSHRAAALTGASALAMYDAAESTPDKLRAAAAMAEVLRRGPKPKSSAQADTGALTGPRLLAALKPISAIIERRNTIPILACVLLQSEGGRLTLSATDLDMSFVGRIRAEGLPDFTAAVEAIDLVAALRTEKGEIGLRLDEPKSQLVVATADGAEMRLPTRKGSDMPIQRAPEASPVVTTMTAERLVEPLRFVHPAISAEETRYYLNGAFMEIAHEDGAWRLAFVATDGSRLMLDRSEDAAGFPEAALNALLPRKAVSWIIAHVSGEAVVSVWDHVIGITTDAGVYYTKLIDGTFPDYRRVIMRDPGAGKIAIEDPEAFNAGVSKLLTISRVKSRSVVLTMEKNTVHGAVVNMEGGRAEAVLPCYCNGDRDIRMSFNGRFLREMVSAPGVLHYFGPDDPPRYEFDGHPGRLAVMMPLRV